MNTEALFKVYKNKAFDLSHRIVLAPMTRIRASEDTLSATALMAKYYQQRASSGGLLITEAIHISPEATPVWSIYPSVKKYGGQVPGIWTHAQTQSWQRVTDAVHEKGGLISCQLLHAGRVAQPEIGEHPLVKGCGLPLPSVSSSAVPIKASAEADNQYNWDQPSVIPRALEVHEIERIIRDYQYAAKNAMLAGFDYVELHAAHGYLIDQFICDGVNRRTDQYGGSVKNRCRFLFELVSTLIETVGPNRLGVRLSPLHVDPANTQIGQIYFAASCSDPEIVYGHAIDGLNRFPLAYLLLTEPRVGGLSAHPEKEMAYQQPLNNHRYRQIYKGTLMGAGGFTPKSATAAVKDGHYDLIAFGRWFLSNPDLPLRLKYGQPLNVYDRASFYGGKTTGYTDYPNMADEQHVYRSRYTLMEQGKIGVRLSNS